MLGGTGHLPVPPFDLSTSLQFLVTAFVIACGILFALKTAASRYFVVDTTFVEDEVAQEEIRDFDHSTSSAMTIQDRAGDGKCFVCGNDGTKECSRCKRVRYCSIGCQSQHWNDNHKFKCRKKEFGPVMLTPVRGIYKVLEQPKKILFPYSEFMKLYYWEKQVFPPCGLLNCGNSCFANVVLQCLSCTRPLVGYFLEGFHSKECTRTDWCFLCELQFHIKKVTQSSQPFSPLNILSRLPNIGSHLGYGRQEDAHEFMRFVVDTMQSIYLDEFGGEKALDPSTQETSLIQHIFGGLFQSQVICTKCNMVSNRYENMMDLTVEIQGEAESLEDCLDKFTAKEWLDGDNKYQCDGCNDYVKAWKRLTVHLAPNILTVTLKRFQSGRFGKLNKRVAIPETVNLGPYMSSTRDGDNLYDLYAVVVHLDMMNASFFGHYICYTKDFRGNWYRIDDCKVMKVELEEVLSQGAYMLLYSRLYVRQPKISPDADRNMLDSVNSKTLYPNNIAPKNKLPVNDNNADARSEQKSDLAVNRFGKSSFDLLSVHDDAHTKITGKCDMNTDKPGTSNLGKAYQKSQISDEDYFQSGKYESTNCLYKVTTIADTSLVHDKLEENPTHSKGFVGLGGDQEADGNVPSSLCEMSMDGGSSYDDREIKTSARSQTSCTYQGTQSLFSRGFLNKQARKKSPKLVNQGICVKNADKCNGVSNMELTVMGANPDVDQSHDSHNKHVNGETKFQVENGKTDCSFEDEDFCTRKSDITNIESNGFLTKLCVEDSITVEVSAKDIQENGPSRDDQCHSEEMSPEKKSEQGHQMFDSHLDLVCENGQNSLPSSLLSASNGFLSKDSQGSGNSNGIFKSKEMDPSEEASLKHISCLNTVSGSDMNGFPAIKSSILPNGFPDAKALIVPNGIPDFKAPVLPNGFLDVKASILPNGIPDFKAPILPNGFLTKSHEDDKICIKGGHSGKTNWPSIDKSLERNSEFGEENFVCCREMQCGNNTNEFGKSDLQISSNGYLSKTGDGCPNRIESNGYSDCTLFRNGIIGRAELLRPLKNKETEHEHDHEVSRTTIEECC